jgi:phage terminase large subunit-like protein
VTIAPPPTWAPPEDVPPQVLEGYVPPVADELSKAEILALIAEAERATFFASLTEDQAAALRWEWEFWARPDQLPPPDPWSVWMIRAGRGVGKTRTGSEWSRKKGPTAREGVLIGANPRDVRDLMIEGRSGILSISPPWEMPRYEPSKLKLTWPNGAVAHIRSAEDPEGIRGLSVEWAWCDEIAKWRYLQESWDMLRFAMREGVRPQTLVTTTPKPLPLIIQLAAGRFPGIFNAPVVSTYRNKAHLADAFIAEIAMSFEGTRLGAQELHGAILTDVEGALWSWALIDAARWQGQWLEQASGMWAPILPEMKKKVCAVDPSGSMGGAETGIVVVGIDRGRPPIAYVLDDRSLRGSPYDWGRAALRAYVDHNCDVMIGERNYGGDMVEHTIKTMPAERDPKTGKEYPSGDYVRFDNVNAGIGKKLRANPVVGLYEQTARGFRRVYHVGTFGDLESQLTAWVPDESPTSPDRLDALVWGINYLIAGKTFRKGGGFASLDRPVG